MLDRGITTKYEVEHLKKLLNTQHLTLELRPKGMEFDAADYDMYRWRARRMDYLQNRLYVASGKMRRDFDHER